MDLDEFRERHWRRSPLHFVDRFIDAERDGLGVEWVQKLVAEMPDADLIYRTASGGAAARMNRVPIDAGIRTSPFATLAENTHSLMLQKVDNYDPGVARIVEEYLDRVANGLCAERSSLKLGSASVFLSSPHAISSFHTDREQNFLVHLIGTKTIHVFPRWRTVAGELVEAVARPRRGIHDEYSIDAESQATNYHLQPGSSLYIPRLFPHWVENGSDVAMSLSINVFCQSGYLIERFYNLNDRLRSGLGRS
jgi:ribosomal protein L16 Arg81 hydroxylase